MAEIKSKGKGKKKQYVIRYEEPRDPKTGKRGQKQKTFKTKAEAKDFLFQMELQKRLQNATPNQEIVAKQEKVPFHQFATHWFEVDYFQDVRVNTFKTRRYYLESHILPFFGDKAIQDITVDDLKQFYALKKREKYSEKTINSFHKFLSPLLKSAVDKGYLQTDPIKALAKKKPKDRIRIPNPWNYGEILQFLEFAEKEKKDVMYDFTLKTGLRQGEVLALPWYNIDFEDESVTVTRSVSYDENGVPELIPKSDKSYRKISLPSYLIEKLKRHKEEQEKMKERYGKHYNHELDLVFPKRDGGFQNPSNVRRQLYRLMEKAQVRRISFHDLRHSHARMLIRSGANPTIVQKRLGHKDINTTFKYYGHLWPNADKEAVQKIEQELDIYKNQQNNPK